MIPVQSAEADRPGTNTTGWKAEGYLDLKVTSHIKLLLWKVTYKLKSFLPKEKIPVNKQK